MLYNEIYKINYENFSVLFFLSSKNLLAIEYSSESSGKETYNFTINTKEGYSKQIRKTEGTWTDSLGKLWS